MIIVILLLLFLSPWALRVDYDHGEFSYSLGKGGFFFSLPKRGPGGEKHQWEKLPQDLSFYRKSHTRLHSLGFELRLGTGDAALTALAVGLLWALFASCRSFFPEKTRLKILPSFKEQPELAVTFSCIFRILPGYIIITTIENFLGKTWERWSLSWKMKNGDTPSKD